VEREKGINTHSLLYYPSPFRAQFAAHHTTTEEAISNLNETVGAAAEASTLTTFCFCELAVSKTIFTSHFYVKCGVDNIILFLMEGQINTTAPTSVKVKI
jgi:hypothetical protein